MHLQKYFQVITRFSTLRKIIQMNYEYIHTHTHVATYQQTKGSVDNKTSSKFSNKGTYTHTRAHPIIHIRCVHMQVRTFVPSHLSHAAAICVHYITG